MTQSSGEELVVTCPLDKKIREVGLNQISTNVVGKKVISPGCNAKNNCGSREEFQIYEERGSARGVTRGGRK